jgi:hypothetical protein
MIVINSERYLGQILHFCVCVCGGGGGVERVTDDEYCYAFFQQDFSLALRARASMDTLG